MTKKQDDFLKSVGVSCEPSAIQNSIVAAFRRNKVYNGNATAADREDLRCALRAEIRKIASDYSAPVTEEAHCKKIQNLSDTLTNQFSRILDGDRFKIGTAQKALNLYLKFLWCLGIHNCAPPHCPLDGIILKKVSIYQAWTKLDCMETYKKWINTIKEKATTKSIPEWELENWNT